VSGESRQPDSRLLRSRTQPRKLDSCYKECAAA